MSAPSEQISVKWVEGAERKCVKCGRPIKNLKRDVGVVRSVYPGPRREIICYGCHVGPARERLGLEEWTPQEGC